VPAGPSQVLYGIADQAVGNRLGRLFQNRPEGSLFLPTGSGLAPVGEPLTP